MANIDINREHEFNGTAFETPFSDSYVINKIQNITFAFKRETISVVTSSDKCILVSTLELNRWSRLEGDFGGGVARSLAPSSIPQTLICH